VLIPGGGAESVVDLSWPAGAQDPEDPRAQDALE
jgi:hypothetical protein